MSKKKLTRRDVFLANMESVVPWVWLIAVIEPYCPRAADEAGRRLQFLNGWFTAQQQEKLVA